MNVDPASVERDAAETGFAPATIEKVVRLGHLLADVGRHPLLSEALVLKGGTPLNLAFGPPARLSVDLDFNYVGSLERKSMLAARPEVERAVQTIAAAQGYAIQRSADAHAGRTLHLSFRNTSGGHDRLQIDVNYLHRLSALEHQTVSIWQPGGRPPVPAKVLATEELVAGKLFALFARRLPRDLFDATRMPDILGARWLEGVTRPLFVALAGSLERPYYHRVRERLRDGARGDLEAELGPMLRRVQRPQAADLRARAWRVIEPPTRPMPAEREFTERLQAGELAPELLFPGDPPLAARIRRTWREGDTVEITLPMGLRAAPMPDDPELVTVMYGPLVLAALDPGADVFFVADPANPSTWIENAPGRFFVKEYPLPASITRGKARITVRFQAHAGATAGGVFGCALLRAK